MQSTQHPLFKRDVNSSSINNAFARHSISSKVERDDDGRTWTRALLPGRIRWSKPLIHVPSMTRRLFFLLRNNFILIGWNDMVMVGLRLVIIPGLKLTDAAGDYAKYDAMLAVIIDNYAHN